MSRRSDPRRLLALGVVGVSAVGLALAWRAAVRVARPVRAAAPALSADQEPPAAPARRAEASDTANYFRRAAAPPSESPPLSERGSQALDRGVAAFKAGQFTAAIEEMERVTVSDPRAPIARAYLGLAYIRVKRYADALKQFQIEGRLLPNPSVSWAHIADTYHAQGNVPAAIQSLEKAVALNPDLAQLHFNLGMIYPEALEIDKGIAALGRCVALEPANHYAHYLRGNLLLRKTRLEEAEAAMQEAIHLQPGIGVYHFGLGQVYLHRQATPQTLQKAHDEFTQALQLGVPEPASLHYYLALCQQQRGDWKSAHSELETSLQLRPNAWRTYRALYETLAHLGEAEQARKAQARFLALRKQEDARTQRSFFEQEAARNPESADARYQLADYLTREGDRARAREELERARQLAEKRGASDDLRRRIAALSADLLRGHGR